MTRHLLVAIACGCGATPELLQIESASPDYGPLVGGTRITVSGTGFLSGPFGTNRVLVGGREAPLVATIDDTTLEVVIPPGGQPGDAELVVLHETSNARATGLFRYSTGPTITSVSPDDVVFSSSETVITLSGSGFLDEGAGTVSVVVDGQLATDVEVLSDTSLTFVAPPGPALARPDIELVDTRGSATRPRAFRYTPSARPGLLLFPSFGAFAVFFDPVDNSTVTIPRLDPQQMRFTAVVRDNEHDYWGLDRNRRFGRIDMKTQTLETPIQTGWHPTLIRVGDEHFTFERGTLRFGTLDPLTGSFTNIGDAALPCCGSFGLAFDGTTLHFASRQAGTVSINTIDRATGTLGTAIPITAAPGFHVEEMRFFDGTLYAVSRNSRLVTIDPATGITTELPVNLGRFNAMEVFE